MYDIESLYEATSVEDACRALAEDPQAIVIAGGTDVLVKAHTWSRFTTCTTSWMA